MELTAVYVVPGHGGGEGSAVLGGGDDAFRAIGGVEGMDKVDMLALFDSRQQAAVFFGDMQRVPAHMGDADGLAAVLEVGREAAAEAGQYAQRFHIVLFTAFKQYLAAKADAEQGLAHGHGLAEHLVHTGGGELVHGLTGRAHAGEDDALGREKDFGVSRYLGRDAKRTERTKHAGLIARFVIEDGKHAVSRVEFTIPSKTDACTCTTARPEAAAPGTERRLHGAVDLHIDIAEVVLRACRKTAQRKHDKNNGGHEVFHRAVSSAHHNEDNRQRKPIFIP